MKPKSHLERNAPKFRTPQEHKKWLDGKPTREELSLDFTALHNGFVASTSRAEQVQDGIETVVRILVEAGIISREDYEARRELQTRFRTMLDDLRSSETMTDGEKVQALIFWNEENPSLQASGTYVEGLVEYLASDALPLETRAEYAAALLIPEEQVFRKEELEALHGTTSKEN